MENAAVLERVYSLRRRWRDWRMAMLRTGKWPSPKSKRPSHSAPWRHSPLRQPALDDVRVLERSDHGHSKPPAIEAVTGAALNVLRRHFENAALDFPGIEHVFVAKQAFAHPHHLIGGALEAHQRLADRVVLRLAQFLPARLLSADRFEFAQDQPHGAFAVSYTHLRAHETPE